ncbi:MAG: PEP-CTERM sorting domain-containing protein [Verrucomicrobiaceae bacterium]|nr:MAG: PEP-CTERM sorting domain-containing protein [Verrucomicrobiaceae bacterium]
MLALSRSHLFRPFMTAAVLGFSALAASAAQVTFTMSGVVTADPTGSYQPNDVITFIFVANSSVPSFESESTVISWYEEELSEPEVFSSVSFTGATGTWSRPSSSEASPESILVLLSESPQNFLISAYADRADDPASRTGLNLGDLSVVGIAAQGELPGTTFSYTGGVTNLGDFFASHAGSYTVTPPTGLNSWIRVLNETTMVESEILFDITSLNVAIPEPSAAVLSFAGVAVVLLRRRRA